MLGRLNSSIIVGVAICLAGAFAAFFSLQIPAEANGDAGARTFPYLGAGALLLLGLLEIRKGLNEPGNFPTLPQRAMPVLGVAVLGIAYVILMTKLGYLVATAVVAPLILWLFGVRKKIGLLAAAILCPAIYYVIFFVLLGVFPPFGEWFDLLDMLQGG